MGWEAENVLSVVLAAEDGSDLPEVECGAHIDLMLRPDLIRQYSLFGDPTDRSQWRIAVLREPDGRGGSSYIHDVLRPGTIVLVAGPRNNFRLLPAPSYLFIAGGIGVTPLLPMLRHVVAQGYPCSFLYLGRRRSSMALLSELEPYRANVTIAARDESDRVDLQQAIEHTAPGTAIYCCGPESLIQAVEEACENIGRLAPHVERFAARARADVVDQGDNDAFEVELSESGQRFLIPADKTIIEVLSEAGVFAPTSCTEGYCGACETRVLAGVPDHRDDYFTEEERAANNRMMICVGRSKTPLLVLKL